MTNATTILGLIYIYYGNYTYTPSHGCKTWSLTLREEHKLGIFENRVLRENLDPRGRK
jgi:hypothetical protein